MKIKRKLIPGEPGTKRWVEKFGKDLLCIRYRYDENQNIKLTTAEIIVNKNTWERNSKKIPPNKKMNIRINYEESRLAGIVKAAGGRWNRQKKLWELAYKEVLALGLEKRIVKLSDKNNKFNNKTVNF
ncbi:MAG: hypothetical protein V1874_04110 [Spirochaetota bacterium]